MNTRIYLRASTKDQDAERALQILQDLNQNLNLGETIVYVENYSGTKLDRPELNKLLSEANQGDTAYSYLLGHRKSIEVGHLLLSNLDSFRTEF